MPKVILTKILSEKMWSSRTILILKVCSSPLPSRTVVSYVPDSLFWLNLHALLKWSNIYPWCFDLKRSLDKQSIKFCSRSFQKAVGKVFNLYGHKFYEALKIILMLSWVLTMILGVYFMIKSRFGDEEFQEKHHNQGKFHYKNHHLYRH